MGKGSKKRKFEDFSNRSHSNNNFVTINHANKVNKVTSIVENFNYDANTQCMGKIWLSNNNFDECIYHTILKEKSPTVVFLDEENITSIHMHLKHLLPIKYIASNNFSRDSLLRDVHNLQNKLQYLLLSIKYLADFQKIIATTKNNTMNTIVNASAIKILTFENIITKNQSNNFIIIHIAQKSNNLRVSSYNKQNNYVFINNWTDPIHKRIKVAMDLTDTLQLGENINKQKSEGTSPDNITETRRNISNKIDALRNKLKVLLSIPLPYSELAKNTFKSNNNNNNNKKIDNQDVFPTDPITNTNTTTLNVLSLPLSNNDSKQIRIKMELLGMIYNSSKKNSVPIHCQAERGRTLAATKWMDGTYGSDYQAPWNEVRYGASSDSISNTVRVIIEGFREFFSSYHTRRNKFRLTKPITISNSPTTSSGSTMSSYHQECQLLSSKLKHKLKKCYIVGIGWNPNPFGDDDTWGGKYGKSCAHNEVVMQYLRPFQPMEVINTHICSRTSPAPGNEKYDGCLEFLALQCQWFERPLTIWDIHSFHYISAKGSITSLPKNSFLSWDIRKIKFYLENLRYLTIECNGSIPPQDLIDKITLLLQLVVGEKKIFILLTTKARKLIVSYCLLGSASNWSKWNGAL